MSASSALPRSNALIESTRKASDISSLQQLSADERNELSDESLLAAYRETGNRSFFDQLMQRYQREIYSYLRRYIGGVEMAEDAFQGTFLQVHLKAHQFDSARRFRPWLYAIATNQAIDVQRRNKRHRMVSLDRTPNDSEQRNASWAEKLVGGTPDPLAAASDQENGHWMKQSIESLGEPMQQVIQLVYYQGLKYREAADVLGIPVGTVKSRLHAAVQRLGVMWEDSHDVPTDE
ncbi:RNA polymerase sigma factor [Roseiconus lacunae]|uniref:RNA polymerase sigma factor n=1 Tax=Roseiconus lacunae TaxID=2605694 RepID=A0ABT7PHW5_9BACT|nr:RNA polymerase sigma factor [Roseiconus lacunae]MCD0461266.1 RNA polymerase sigma factor [Roseiconus lacunae]MDM4016093.1 RNA polymerase sigma factor [Roseiconus lacunae]WRQ51574.1 RNA polymerase sigma factor [Stieleria sp. HD01]